MNQSWQVKTTQGNLNLGQFSGVEAIQELIRHDLFSLLNPVIALSREPVKRCPACGWTETKRIALGYLGCPLCYEALTIAPKPVSGASDLVS